MSRGDRSAAMKGAPSRRQPMSSCGTEAALLGVLAGLTLMVSGCSHGARSASPTTVRIAAAPTVTTAAPTTTAPTTVPAPTTRAPEVTVTTSYPTAPPTYVQTTLPCPSGTVTGQVVSQTDVNGAPGEFHVAVRIINHTTAPVEVSSWEVSTSLFSSYQQFGAFSESPLLLSPVSLTPGASMSDSTLGVASAEPPPISSEGVGVDWNTGTGLIGGEERLGRLARLVSRDPGRGRHDRASPGETRLGSVSRCRQFGKIWCHDVRRRGSA